MGVQSTFGALRKLGHFLVGLSPALQRRAERARDARRRWLERPLPGRVRAWLRGSPRVAALLELARTFYWSNYARDRPDATRVPADGRAVLRAALAVSVALALTAPLSLTLPGPTVVVAEAPPRLAAGWSAALWPAALALCWALLLAGSALANRAVQLFTSVSFLYLSLGLVTLGYARSYANVVPALVLLAAVWAGERVRSHASRSESLRGGLVAAATGVAAGAFVAVLTPLGAGFGPSKAAVGAAVGALLALAAHRLARVGRGESGEPRPPSLPWMVAGFASAIALFLYAHLALRGLATTARGMLPVLEFIGGYLWPLWYLVGVGLVFKVLASTGAVARAIEVWVPSRWLAPLVVLSLLAGTLVLWSPSVIDSPAVRWPDAVSATAAFLYRATRGLLWNQPAAGTTADIVRWIFPVALLVALLKAARRRLDAASAGALTYQLLLAVFAANEYVSQLFGFGRTPSRSAAVYAVNAVSTLWMLQSSAMRAGLSTSVRWPARARMALLGGVLVLALLEQHARAAAHDTRAQEQISYYLFRGILDAGPAVALYVWASRGAVKLPLPASRLLAAFCAGAAATLPLTALDRLDASGWSLADLDAALDSRARRLIDGELAALDGDGALDPSWAVARAALIVAAWCAAAWWCERREGGRESASARGVLTLVAVGLGLAAASKAQLALPFLSPRWMVLLSPERRSTGVDAHFVASFVTYAVPALAMGALWFSRGDRAGLRRAAGALAAFGLMAASLSAWPAREPWLTASGSMPLLGAAALVALSALVWVARARLDAAGGAPASPRTARLVGVSALAATTALAAAIGLRLHAERIVPRALPGVAAALPLPASWEARAGAAGVFQRSTRGALPPVLVVTVERSEPGEVRALLIRRAEEASRALPAFELVRRSAETPRAYGGALLEYAFEMRPAGGPSVPVMGTTLILPQPGQRALTMTLVATLDDWRALRWTPSLVAQRMAEGR